MIEFTQEELFKATNQYMENRAQLVARAEASVVEWKYASAEMFGMFPLFDAIGFRGCYWWTPAERRWLGENVPDEWYLHAFNTEGDIRIIKGHNQTVSLFFREGEIVDEVRYGYAVPLTRSILEDGRVVAAYEYVLYPHQYRLEQFEYTAGRCARSVEQCWYVSDGEWEKATWTTTCEFDYDQDGLRRVYRDSVGGRKLVYVRPAAIPSGSPAMTWRRPLVAHEVGISDKNHPWPCVYSHAYGLEMTIDNAWPIDTVLLAPPTAVCSITQDTGVTSMGTVYGGAAFMPPDGDLAPIVADGAKWLLLEAVCVDAPSFLRVAWSAGLNVILMVEGPRQVTKALGSKERVASERLAVAIRAPSEHSPQWARAVARDVRNELRGLEMGETRILIAANLTKDNVMDYVSFADVDGVLLSGGDASLTLDLLIPLALNVQGGDWKRP